VSIFEHTESSDMEEVFMDIATELDAEFEKGDPA
jgi:hypothetical protein